MKAIIVLSDGESWEEINEDSRQSIVLISENDFMELQSGAIEPSDLTPYMEFPIKVANLHE